jgi:hypothetical protein
MVHGHFNSHHICCIREIASLDEFTGIVSVGVALNYMNAAINIDAEDDDLGDDIVSSQEQLELQEDEEEDKRERQVDNDMIYILIVSLDNVQLKDS